MSCPSKTIRPASGRYTPLIRLNTVDLPAPLGPMRPRISPSSTLNVRLETASRPPKRLLSAVTSSTALIEALGSFEHLATTREALVQPSQQAARREQHDREQKRSGDYELKVRKRFRREEEPAQLLVEKGAERRSNHGAVAAQHQHHDRLDRLGEVERAVRLDDTALEEIKTASNRREEGRDAVDERLVAPRID